MQVPPGYQVATHSMCTTIYWLLQVPPGYQVATHSIRTALYWLSQVPPGYEVATLETRSMFAASSALKLQHRGQEACAMLATSMRDARFPSSAISDTVPQQPQHFTTSHPSKEEEYDRAARALQRYFPRQVMCVTISHMFEIVWCI